MVRAWRSADIAACRAVSNPVWFFREFSGFSEKYHISPLSILGHGVSLGKTLQPQMLSLTHVKMSTW